jgi:site-specific DNA recombinase
MQMLGVFAQFERSSIVERIAAGMERKAKSGGWTVGTYPYGYRKLGGTAGLAPDPAAAPVVLEIFRRYAEDQQGSTAIAAALNARGLRTRYGHLWSCTAILDILRNRVYLGEVPFRGIWYIGHHEPLITPELFDAAGAILARRAAEPGSRRTDASDYLLSGLRIVCDRCGQRLIGAAARGRGGRRYAYYTCYARSRYGRTGCDQARLPKDELEEAILGQMSEVYADTSLIGTALVEMEAELRKSEAAHAEKRVALDAEAVELRVRIDRYFASFEAGQLSPELCRERVEGLQARIRAIEDERMAIPDGVTEQAIGPDEIAFISWSLSEALGEILGQIPTPRTKALLRLLIEEIRVVSPTDIRPTYRVPTAKSMTAVTEEEGAVREQKGMVEMRGLEPLTPAMRTRCSSS